MSFKFLFGLYILTNLCWFVLCLLLSYKVFGMTIILIDLQEASLILLCGVFILTAHRVIKETFKRKKTNDTRTNQKI